MRLSYDEIQRIKQIAEMFEIVPGEITHVMKVDSGRINSTYKITVTCEDDTVSYMLQKINSNVFKDAELLMRNAIEVSNHLRKKGYESLEFIKTKSGHYLLSTDSGYFRMTKFIHAEVFQYITRPKDMYLLGFAVGTFSIGLSDFDAEHLVDTIPFFHDTRVRYQDLLRTAINNIHISKADSRVKETEEELKFVDDNRMLFGIIVDALTSKDIPYRVTHNDTKLNNVLFDRKTNMPRCLIDLDTTMKGSLLYDLADAIRSGANVRSEDENEESLVQIDLNLMKEFLKGFAEAAPGVLTPKEIELLPTAIRMIPFELGIRFLTDYYNFDQYFSVVNENDNLMRARVQFALVKDIDKKMTDIERIVKEVF